MQGARHPPWTRLRTRSAHPRVESFDHLDRLPQPTIEEREGVYRLGQLPHPLRRGASEDNASSLMIVLGARHLDRERFQRVGDEIEVSIRPRR